NARPTETKLSRQARIRKNKKLRRDQKQAEMLYELDVDIPLLIDDIGVDKYSLCSSDRVSTKKNKTQYDISARELLIEALIREAKSSDKNDVGIEGSSPNTTNKRLLLWKKLWYAHNIQSDRDFQDLFDTATAFNTRRKKAHLIISAYHNPQSISELVQFKHIAEPEYITNLSGRTLVHLEQLDDYNAIILATNTVNNYYFHTNNLLPFTSSNTASTHNINHYECVNKLLQGLKALSDCVNRFLRDYYRNLYTKLSRLLWGPFAPKPFEVFPMIAINFNTTSDYHWDEHNEANTDFTKAYIKAGIKKGANRPIVSEQDLNNAQGLNYQTHPPKPKAKQIQVPSALLIIDVSLDLARARQGLKAEDLLPDL
ncbi:34631_t:CDS:2, partial [Racocetra persica]